MTLPRLAALNKHWRKFPPVHVSAALFTGIEPATPRASAPAANDAAITNAELVRDMPIPRHAVKWINGNG